MAPIEPLGLYFCDKRCDRRLQNREPTLHGETSRRSTLAHNYFKYYYARWYRILLYIEVSSSRVRLRSRCIIGNVSRALPLRVALFLATAVPLENGIDARDKTLGATRRKRRRSFPENAFSPRFKCGDSRHGGSADARTT